MNNCTAFAALLTAVLVTASLPLSSAYAAKDENFVDLQNDEMDVTLFRGAANNSYFDV